MKVFSIIVTGLQGFTIAIEWSSIRNSGFRMATKKKKKTAVSEQMIEH